MGTNASHSTKLPHNKLLSLVAILSLRVQHTYRRIESLQTVRKPRHKPILPPSRRRMDLPGRRPGLSMRETRSPAQQTPPAAEHTAKLAAEPAEPTKSSELSDMSKPILHSKHNYQH